MSHLSDCPLGAWERDFDAWLKMEDSEARSAELARLLDELRRITVLVGARADTVVKELEEP